MGTATLPAKPKRRWTDNQLMALPNDGRKFELIDGDLIMSPVRENHSWICINIVLLLGAFVRRQKLGRVYDSSLGCRLSSKVMLSPDVSFVSNTRLKEIMASPDQFLQGAPDLVVEVLSPGDSRKMIAGKISRYFEHGAKLAWLVDPKKQTVTVHHAKGSSTLDGLDAVLIGGDAVPGFACRLREIFLGE